ncbi:4-(cytidine 5'-diphospho)-2-C-methyl-D-erythritol kinase [uncultured Prevotella sp.]|mgnify:CR=1 FL=1|uniref:4-(cytidine 5'-diphospho)-2-C-methyl-D-erythritol kinase n=1 Tax=uncultured Prevotella sp. TaxID=159272 RepID=UPI00262BBADE|nr:4-(cytidine 5'-diphospho)-2-C-methyl-D-erythritol kinase [uncultured Prevotella sp.]
MIQQPCAKINLGLNITSKRPDGYHNLETVFYPINIRDEICIKPENEKSQSYQCTLSINGISIDGDLQQNLIVKAYNLIKKYHAEVTSINVTLTKNIPTQAGMGGGSSDCAYTIRMLNHMYNLNMSIQEMQSLAAKLGADCPFFINPIPSFATGIGDILTPVNMDLSPYKIAVVKPDIKISTKEAFTNITVQKPIKCCRDIVMQPIETWKDELVNDFEKNISSIYPEIIQIKNKLYDLGAIYASMTGSGSAVFGIFNKEIKDLDKVFNNCYVCLV